MVSRSCLLLLLAGCHALPHSNRPSLSPESTVTTKATVYEGGAFRFGVIDKDGVAWGEFEDGLNETGWGILDIETSHMFSDDEQAFAAGMIEGALTAHHIYSAQINLFPNVFGDDADPLNPPKEVVNFLDSQYNWTLTQIAQNTDDPFWRQVNYVMQQFQGLVAGYGEEADKGTVPQLPLFAFHMLNGVGDLFDIIPAVVKEKRVDWLSLSKRDAEQLHSSSTHCSALIKLTGNYSDLIMAHSSWYMFANTDRIFKHYHFNFADKSTAAQQVSFSSYPGFLESLDDFYMLSSGLAWTQTSNGVLDTTAYDVVTSESLLAWQRVRVASSMASSGEEWHHYFSNYASGTYANQYMIVDFNLFTPNTPLKAGTLWVVEEMPGLIVGADQTTTLALGHWPSYNIPYYPGVYEKSGYPAMAAKKGNYFTYSLCPRAQIFRRDHGSVVDVESMKTLLRFNDYKNDPYSFDGEAPNPDYAICSRWDLRPSGARAGGCYDTKVSSYQYGVMDLKAQAINGPTVSGGQVPMFTWDEFDKETHFALPHEYSFDFIPMQPKTL